MPQEIIIAIMLKRIDIVSEYLDDLWFPGNGILRLDDDGNEGDDETINTKLIWTKWGHLMTTETNMHTMTIMEKYKSMSSDDHSLPGGQHQANYGYDANFLLSIKQLELIAYSSNWGHITKSTRMKRYKNTMRMMYEMSTHEIFQRANVIPSTHSIVVWLTAPIRNCILPKRFGNSYKWLHYLMEANDEELLLRLMLDGVLTCPDNHSLPGGVDLRANYDHNDDESDVDMHNTKCMSIFLEYGTPKLLVPYFRTYIKIFDHHGNRMKADDINVYQCIKTIKCFVDRVLQKNIFTHVEQRSENDTPFYHAPYMTIDCILCKYNLYTTSLIYHACSARDSS
jgi:hypothetical protein